MKKSRFVALPMAMLMASFALIGCTETTESSPSSPKKTAANPP